MSEVAPSRIFDLRRFGAGPLPLPSTHGMIDLWFWERLPPGMSPELYKRAASHEMRYWGIGGDPEVSMLADMLWLHGSTATATLNRKITSLNVYADVARFVDVWGEPVVKRLIERYNLDPALIPRKPDLTDW